MISYYIGKMMHRLVGLPYGHTSGKTIAVME